MLNVLLYIVFSLLCFAWTTSFRRNSPHLFSILHWLVPTKKRKVPTVPQTQFKTFQVYLSILLFLQGTFLKQDCSVFSCFIFVISNQRKQCKDCISPEYPKWNAFSQLIMLFPPVMRCGRHWVSSCRISAQDFASFSHIVFILFCLWQVYCTCADNEEFTIQQFLSIHIELFCFWQYTKLKFTVVSGFPDLFWNRNKFNSLQLIGALLLWIKYKLIYLFWDPKEICVIYFFRQ